MASFKIKIQHKPLKTLTYFCFTILSSSDSWSLRAGIALASLDTAMRNSCKTQQALNKNKVTKLQNIEIPAVSGTT